MTGWLHSCVHRAMLNTPSSMTGGADILTSRLNTSQYLLFSCACISQFLAALALCRPRGYRIGSNLFPGWMAQRVPIWYHSSARDVFVRRIVALLPWCLSICLSSGTDMHSDHTVHVSMDLSLWLDSPVFWAPWHLTPKHVHLVLVTFVQFHLEHRCGMGEQSRRQEWLKIELSYYRVLMGSHMCCILTL